MGAWVRGCMDVSVLCFVLFLFEASEGMRESRSVLYKIVGNWQLSTAECSLPHRPRHDDDVHVPPCLLSFFSLLCPDNSEHKCGAKIGSRDKPVLRSRLSSHEKSNKQLRKRESKSEGGTGTLSVVSVSLPQCVRMEKPKKKKKKNMNIQIELS